MIQTLKAIVTEGGKISLLEEVSLKEPRRALVTILDERPKVSIVSKKENLRAVFGKMRNLEMFQNIEDVSMWQKNLRND